MLGVPSAAGLGRREFLRHAAALPLFTSGVAATAADDRPGGTPGVITRQRKPDNLEFPFATLDRFLTPNEQFYVRTHFEIPALAVRHWSLSIAGAVERPFELSYDELRKMPARTAPALLECSGNGRVFLDPPQVGIRWELGGVSNAEWTGVPLATVLERAGLKPEAVEVVLEGADQGEYRDPLPKTPGKIAFARSLPRAKATSPEVLLAYKMNGEDLPPAHGHPVRAIVPGWYGMASVKWLKRIIVVDRPFDGYFQTFQYAVWTRAYGIPSLVPVTEVQVKAQIARPMPGEVVSASSMYRVHGAAWTGEADVAKVELSDDGGKTWAEAKLLDKPIRHAWRLWEYAWKVPSQPGNRVLMARATDSQGRVQPTQRDPDRRDAMISHILPIDVVVR